MRTTILRRQLPLEWTDELRWDELPATVRAELRGMLRRLLEGGAAGDDHGEGGHDQ